MSTSEELIEVNPYEEFQIEIPALITTAEEILEDRRDKKPQADIQLDFLNSDEDPETLLLEKVCHHLDRFKSLYMTGVRKGVNPRFHKEAVDHFIGKVGQMTVVCGLDGEWLNSEMMFQHHANKVLANGKKANTDVFIGQLYIWAKELDRSQKTKMAPRLMHHFYRILSIGTEGQLSAQLELLSNSRAKDAGIAVRYSGGGSGGLIDQVIEIFGEDEDLGDKLRELNSMEVRGLLQSLKDDSQMYGVAKSLITSAMSGEQDGTKLLRHLDGVIPAEVQDSFQKSLTHTQAYMERQEREDGGKEPR